MGEHAKPQTGVNRRLHLKESVHGHCTDLLCEHTVHPVSVNSIGAEVLLQDSPCHHPNLHLPLTAVLPRSLSTALLLYFVFMDN